MNQEKKIEKILETALTEELEDHLKLLKVMKRKLPFFGGTKRIAAALLKEHLGDVSRLDLNAENLLRETRMERSSSRTSRTAAPACSSISARTTVSPPATSSARSSNAPVSTER